jgi:methionyl-tRNA formyltransferase
MKIVFFGTPSIAVECLNKLITSGYDVVAVVTVTDKEQGRGKKILPSPVKEFAIKYSIPVLQPESLKSEEFLNELKTINADLFIIVAFKILPATVFNLPKYGSFNLHGSLLPKYRGAAPIQWAIINGDKVTGLTTFALADKVDTGNIYIQKTVTIEESDNFGSLYQKMSEVGSELVVDTVKIIESKKISLLPQDNSLSSPAPKITKEVCEINFGNSASKIHNLVRGLSPSPGAYFIHNGKQYKVLKTALSDKTLKPGEIFTTKKEIFIGCSEGSLQILEIQPEGKRKMDSASFLMGQSIAGCVRSSK